MASNLAARIAKKLHFTVVPSANRESKRTGERSEGETKPSLLERFHVIRATSAKAVETSKAQGLSTKVANLPKVNASRAGKLPVELWQTILQMADLSHGEALDMYSTFAKADNIAPLVGAFNISPNLFQVSTEVRSKALKNHVFLSEAAETAFLQKSPNDQKKLRQIWHAGPGEREFHSKRGTKVDFDFLVAMAPHHSSSVTKSLSEFRAMPPQDQLAIAFVYSKTMEGYHALPADIKFRKDVTLHAIASISNWPPHIPHSLLHDREVVKAAIQKNGSTIYTVLGFSPEDHYSNTDPELWNIALFTSQNPIRRPHNPQFQNAVNFSKFLTTATSSIDLTMVFWTDFYMARFGSGAARARMHGLV